MSNKHNLWHVVLSMLLLTLALVIVFIIYKTLVPHFSVSEKHFALMLVHPVRAVVPIELVVVFVFAGSLVVAHLLATAGHIAGSERANEKPSGFLFFLMAVISCAMLLVAEEIQNRAVERQSQNSSVIPERTEE